jgi:Delta24(24(1))-sterol reductase
MVETPLARSSRRKSQLPLDSDLDGDSSSAPESNLQKTRSVRRRAPKFVEHIDETEDETTVYGSKPAMNRRKGIPDFDTDAKPVANGVNGTNGHAKHAPLANGNANGHANGKADDRLVDGWRPGLDHRIDYSGEKEFLGVPGVSVVMLGFPIIMWYMWVGATYYDGHFPMPEAGESWGDFAYHLLNLVYTGAFPTTKAWLMYWVFFVFEGALYCLLPGVEAYGKPLAFDGGKQLKYWCSGLYSWYTTIATMLTLHFTGLVPLYTIVDEFGPLLTVAILSGTLVSVVAYFSALYRGAQHRMTGSFIYDFFMGAELNPRMFGILDFKMFFEVRLPWYILFLISCGTAARQYQNYGYVSGEAWFLVMAHFLYANACSKGEELIVTTWDMYYEKWGFMLIFWNMAGVPLSYCHCSIYLANHHPDEYHWNPYALTAMFIGYIFVYWVWDSCNSQKNRFRAAEKGRMITRKTFPQVPWQTLKNPRIIKTNTGDSILLSGWYGLARKVHYTCDAYFAVMWGLITGFKSVLAEF